MTNESITSSKYPEINEIAKKTAGKDLSEMVATGVIKSCKGEKYKIQIMPELIQAVEHN